MRAIVKLLFIEIRKPVISIQKIKLRWCVNVAHHLLFNRNSEPVRQETLFQMKERRFNHALCRV